MTYFAFDFLERAPDNWRPSLSRTRALLDAIKQSPDFELLEAHLQRPDASTKQECLIVEVTCDGVPPENKAGIQYRERLALIVPQNDREYVDVFAIRQDFPILPHMNATPDHFPLSLCLYFEPKSVVFRTWTPQKFLRKIQWWLTATAREELHAADQPVEQLFYLTRHELVLPWNFSAAITLPDTKCYVTNLFQRPDKGYHLTTAVLPKNKAPNETNASLIFIDAPPIIHGRVERIPTTLDSLIVTMARRGVDALTLLYTALLESMPESGIQTGGAGRNVVILLRTPIVREADGTQERLLFTAFFLNVSEGELGLKIGAYITHDGRYYAYRTGQADTAGNAPWKTIALDTIDVLTSNDRQHSRQQSDVADAGPNGVIIGAGSLGSALLNIWSRNGWGTWSVIDNDHIKPHNLVRHTAYSQHVGQQKVNVVASLYTAVTQGAAQITAINADASTLTADVVSSLQKSTLVIDASASLECPRSISKITEMGRAVSVFMSPDGNSAVLLAEDRARSIRLLPLEGQYYRAIINNAWGRNHLDGHLGTYWSGGSCRDISVALSYSRVMAQAACLAEQIQIVDTHPDAIIKVWRRTPETGEVAMHETPAHSVRSMKYGTLDVYIDQGLEHKLHEMRTEKIPSETGGILLGYYDLSGDFLVIVDAIPAPPDSISTPTSFERGTEGVSERLAEVRQLTADIVGYIGEWHSHPPGCPASPSRDDLIQLTQLALGMAEDGLPAISLIVAEGEIKIYQGQVYGRN